LPLFTQRRGSGSQVLRFHARQVLKPLGGDRRSYEVEFIAPLAGFVLAPSREHLTSAALRLTIGPHLPLHLDTLAAAYYARVWGKALDAYVLPTMPFNTSEEHASFKGTVSLTPATVMLVLEEIVGGLREQGLRKQVLTVGHGGSLWLGAFVKHVNRRFVDVVVGAHSGAGPVWEEALRLAALAGRGEVCGGAISRALALYLAPGVRDGGGIWRADLRRADSLRGLHRVGEDHDGRELGSLRAGR
jgi:hypothetical protein